MNWKMAPPVTLIMALMVYGQSPQKLTKADIDRWMTELSNWGRWGKGPRRNNLYIGT